MAGACLQPFRPFFDTVSGFLGKLVPLKRRSTSKTSQMTSASSPPPSPYAQSYSTPTFLSLPRPKPARFHDRTSDLDFDLFDPPTTRSRAHSRNPSNLTLLSQFANFTSNFSVPPFDQEAEATQVKDFGRENGERDGVELQQQDQIYALKDSYAVSVTSGAGETCDGSEDERTVRRMASDDSWYGAGSGGILRTREVTVN